MATREDATLVIKGKEGGWFGFFMKNVDVEYDLNIVTLPKLIGTVTVSYALSVPRIQEKATSQEVAHNSSSRDWNCQPYKYLPSRADRRFDPDRSSVVAGSGNSRGRLQDVSVRDVGITFNICAKRRKLDKDNGYRHAIVKYVEVWPTEEVKPLRVAEPLHWTKDLAVPIENAAKGPTSLLVCVADFTGSTRTVTIAGGKAGNFANVTYDANSKAVLVKPLIPKTPDSL
jgi:hypothetical protein